MHLPYIIAAFIPALTFHEWGHAVMATRFGDPTPKHAGRLTLNPFAHLDPLGTILVFIIHFGWGKPVPINPNNFRSSWAEFWVASAGPLMNFVLATVAAVLIRLGAHEWLGQTYSQVLLLLLWYSLIINLTLGFFNLLPIGPLDGHTVLARLLPRNLSQKFSDWNLAYGGTVLFGLFILDWVTRIGILSRMIHLPTQIAASLLLGERIPS